jgi:hypothetical protein
MADIVPSLFGLTPEMYQQNQAALADKQALAFAQLTPMQQAQYGISRGAYQLAGALGGQDPQLQLISNRNAIAKQIDYNNPESMMQGVNALTQAGDTIGAMQLADVARKMQSEMAQRFQRTAAAETSQAQATKLAAEEARLKLTTQQEQSLRDEIAKLGANPTDDQILAVMTKYGPADKVMAALQAREGRREAIASREEMARLQRESQATLAEQARIEREARAAADREARAEAARIAAEARTEAARIAAEARLEAARERNASAAEVARLRADSAREMAALKESLKGPKVLAAGLQKEEDKDLELIDNLTARNTTLAPAIQALTPDPKTKKPFLELGPIRNSQYMAQNFAGNSTEQSRAFANLQRSVQEATNLKTDAAKGVQTDKDVLRFANELVAAFGKFDTQTTLEALTNFRNATQAAQDRTKARIDSRRKAQNVDPYFGGAARGTVQNPIKLD